MSRGDAFITVACDNVGCDEEIAIPLTALAGRGEWDERSVNSKLKRAGWVRRDGEDFCDGCAEAMDRGTE